LLEELAGSGLTGRGGAGFPAYMKALSVRRAGGQTVVVANAMEGEPASGKDEALLHRSPHLVLDGALVMAAVLGSSRVVVCVADDREALAAHVRRALHERRAARADGPSFELASLPHHYVAGEESALVAALSGRRGVPEWRQDKSLPLAFRGPLALRPRVLVHNAETLANVALIARHGARWWRSVGSVGWPGTVLVTISGGVGKPGVYEFETGRPIADMLARAGIASPLQGVLVGGYGGTWLSPRQLATPLSPEALRALGASVGAGVLVALGPNACGLSETARVARWMAGESAGQCGPCLFGLPAIAGDLEEIVAGTAGPALYERLLSRCALVPGRGACRHPDGVVRLVQSALRVFATDVEAHLAGAPCTTPPFPGTARSPVLPVPSVARARKEG
jgi:NADH:ubiquinone oxidoreductase subunit F (NADH-binding)